MMLRSKTLGIFWFLYDIWAMLMRLIYTVRILIFISCGLNLILADLFVYISFADEYTQYSTSCISLPGEYNPLILKNQIHKWYSDSFSWSEHHANPRVNEARYALIASEWRGRDQWPGKNKSFYALLVLWRRPTATARRKIETFGQGNSSLSSPVSRLFVGIRCKCPKTCNPVFLIVGNKGIRMTNMARPR